MDNPALNCDDFTQTLHSFQEYCIETLKQDRHPLPLAKLLHADTSFIASSSPHLPPNLSSNLMQGRIRPQNKQQAKFKPIQVTNASFLVDNRTTLQGDHLCVDSLNSNLLFSPKFR